MDHRRRRRNRAIDQTFKKCVSFLVLWYVLYDVCVHRIFRLEGGTATDTASDISPFSSPKTFTNHETATIDSSPEEPVEDHSWATWWHGPRTACCRDFWDNYKAGDKNTDGSVKLPPSCMLEGASCELYGVKPRDSALSLSGSVDSRCIDNKGNARASAAGDADVLNVAGGGLPTCAAEASSWTGLGIPWEGYVLIVLGLHVLAFFYTGRHRLKYGDQGRSESEKVTYPRRCMATSTLWVLDGGGPLLFAMADVFLIHGIYIAWGKIEAFWLFLDLVLFTYATMRPLPTRFPRQDLIKSGLYRLWNDYFEVEFISEFAEEELEKRDKGKRRRERKRRKKGKKYLIAQMPHGIMPFGAILGVSLLDDALPGIQPVSGVVATVLMLTPVLRHFMNSLGVRAAGSEAIHKMFEDGYQAVTVVTGGIAEMFVSGESEILTCLRLNFARVALTGGYDIIPIFAFGNSRTLTVVPGFNNWVIRAISRKVPAMLYWGAFGLVPHRQKLLLAAGRAIEVEKVEGPVSDDACRELCKRVQDAVKDMYNRRKPSWETRSIRFVT